MARTKVKFKYSDLTDAKRYKVGDVGFIDGYIWDGEDTMAIVLIGGNIVSISIADLVVIGCDD